MRIDAKTARMLTNLVAAAVAVGVAGLWLIAVFVPGVPIVVIWITVVMALGAGILVAVVWAGRIVSQSIRMLLREHQ